MAHNPPNARGPLRKSGPNLATLTALALGFGCAQPGELQVADGAEAASRGAELFERHCELCHAPSARALGAAVYRNQCAVCHGEEGRGHPEAPLPDDDGTLNWARDFTAGVLKGGATHAELSRRLQVGMHGSAMPSAALGPEERAAVITHLRSLIPRGTEERLVQRRRTIRAAAVVAPLDLEGGSAPWESAEEVDLALAPLWWREGAILGARVAALCDGETLAVRIRWADPTPDAPLSKEPPYQLPPYADAVALQLSSASDPPLFGMGDSPGVNIWHWRARDVFEIENLGRVDGGLAHRLEEGLDPRGVLDVPLYQEARGTAWVSGEAVSVEPEGMRNIEAQHPTATRIAAFPSWRAGEWQVVLARSLQTSAPGEVALPLGRPLSVSFAIWNGAIGDLRGQKSITIWHELVIPESAN
jgi:DMSO reductase family type II enzyme heme b subunit